MVGALGVYSGKIYVGMSAWGVGVYGGGTLLSGMA